MEEFDHMITSTAKGHLGSSWGWADGVVEHPSLEGVQGRCFVVVIGWESIQRHENFRRLNRFRDGVGLLRHPQVKAMEWCYLRVRQEYSF